MKILDIISDAIFVKKEVKLIMVGLDYSGKSTVVEILRPKKLKLIKKVFAK